MLTFDEKPVEIARKRIRHFYIRVSPPEGHVCISAPVAASDDAIRHLLAERQAWVRQQQQRIAEREQAYPVAPALMSGSQHLFEGRDLTLVIEETAGRAEARIKGQSLFLRVPPGSSELYRREVVEKMYRQALQARLPPLIKAWEPIMGVQVAEWRVRRMKRLWGSCNVHAHRIWLNLDLIRRPPAALEFVLVHEMTHLLERGHNRRFYQLMDQFMPDWRERRKGLYARMIYP